MIYKVVPGPTLVSGTATNACDVFEGIINKEAAAGWKFVSMETITTESSAGCSSNAPTKTSVYMLIFCKEQ